ncbi:hypothetical protein H5T51_05005 [Candidatus Bathyarchaeota archaeon]|nr:hypothetical protein [Candidatus Bathyarchaeota archaeon]
MKPEMLDYLFVCFVIVVSFTPLLPFRGWQGYGPAGEFYYTGDVIQLRYNDPTFGNDKPHVFVSDAGRPVSLIEFSDHNSYVDDLNIYANFTVKTRLEEGVLKAFYASPGVSFVKIVEPGESHVAVTYVFSHNVTFLLTLWRWYFMSVGPFTMPVTRKLEPSSSINFSVAESGRIYSAQLLLEPLPENVTVSGVHDGLNKISLSFKAEKVTVKVKLVSSHSSSVFFAVDVRESKILYPVIAVAASSVYLWLKRALKGRCCCE